MIGRRRGLALVALVALSTGVGGCSSGSDDARSPTTERGGGGAVPTVSAVRSLSGRPADIAYAEGVLWVSEDEGGTVQRLDATTGEPIGSPIPATSAPASIAAAGTSAILADALGVVTRVDGPTGTVQVSSEQPGASYVDLVADSGRLWLVDIAGGSVSGIDETGEVVWTTRVPGGAVRAARAAELLWVTGLEDTVSALDPATGAVVVGPSPVGAGPIGMAGAGGALWVANGDDGTVSRLDPRTGLPKGAAARVGQAPIAVAGDGSVLWVLNQDSHTLTRLDAASGDRLGADVALPIRPRNFVVTPAGVWVVGVDAPGLVLVSRP